MVTRKAVVRPRLTQAPHFQWRAKPLRQIAHCIVLSPVWTTCAGDAHAFVASSRDENWRKKCRPHKNDAIISNETESRAASFGARNGVAAIERSDAATRIAVFDSQATCARLLKFMIPRGEPANAGRGKLSGQSR